MAAARASIGAKLKSVTIDCCDRFAFSKLDVLEFKRHVLQVELSRYGADYGGYDDEEREGLYGVPPGE